MEKTKSNNIVKSSWATQALLYISNVLRLLDQEEYWFCERILSLQKNDHVKVEFIEENYLKPLNRKIKELAERMSRL